MKTEIEMEMEEEEEEQQNELLTEPQHLRQRRASAVAAGRGKVATASSSSSSSSSATSSTTVTVSVTDPASAVAVGVASRTALLFGWNQLPSDIHFSIGQFLDARSLARYSSIDCFTHSSIAVRREQLYRTLRRIQLQLQLQQHEYPRTRRPPVAPPSAARYAWLDRSKLRTRALKKMEEDKDIIFTNEKHFQRQYEVAYQMRYERLTAQRDLIMRFIYRDRIRYVAIYEEFILPNLLQLLFYWFIFSLVQEVDASINNNTQNSSSSGSSSSSNSNSSSSSSTAGITQVTASTIVITWRTVWSLVLMSLLILLSTCHFMYGRWMIRLRHRRRQSLTTSEMDIELQQSLLITSSSSSSSSSSEEEEEEKEAPIMDSFRIGSTSSFLPHYYYAHTGCFLHKFFLIFDVKPVNTGLSDNYADVDVDVDTTNTMTMTMTMTPVVQKFPERVTLRMQIQMFVGIVLFCLGVFLFAIKLTESETAATASSSSSSASASATNISISWLHVYIPFYISLLICCLLLPIQHSMLVSPPRRDFDSSEYWFVVTLLSPIILCFIFVSLNILSIIRVPYLFALMPLLLYNIMLFYVAKRDFSSDSIISVLVWLGGYSLSGIAFFIWHMILQFKLDGWDCCCWWFTQYSYSAICLLIVPSIIGILIISIVEQIMWPWRLQPTKLPSHAPSVPNRFELPAEI